MKNSIAITLPKWTAIEDELYNREILKRLAVL